MLNPWLRLPEAPPYVLTVDADLVDELYPEIRGDKAIRRDSLPGPFLGRMDAPVVLLNLKPGFDENDLTAERDLEYRAGVLAQLRGDVRQPYPGFLFDPRFAGTPGGRYYREAMNDLAAELRLRVEDPWKAIAQSILFVQYFPYHSVSAPLHQRHLPSQRYGFQVVRDAVSRGALVGVLLGATRWCDAVREIREKVVLTGKNQRTWFFSRNNCGDAGFDAVRDRVVGAVSSLG